MAMVEPFWVSRKGATAAASASSARDGLAAGGRRRPAASAGRVRHDLTADAVARSIAVASGLGTTSAYSWLKLPVVDDMERVLAASTLPVLLLGGDAGESEDEADEMFERWTTALALPTVRGIVAGRALLYPPDDDVDAAVDRAVSLLAAGTRGTEAADVGAQAV
jgi:DhnA family fructose-bisphosphate aldolase class Ia